MTTTGTFAKFEKAADGYGGFVATFYNYEDVPQTFPISFADAAAFAALFNKTASEKSSEEAVNNIFAHAAQQGVTVGLLYASEIYGDIEAHMTTEFGRDVQYARKGDIIYYV